ncbi:MAG TPA: hypothetical protein VMR50_04565 [Myxococcota bacterium]|nr:hypothetical protein [Myxococcota bacterium]
MTRSAKLVFLSGSVLCAVLALGGARLARAVAPFFPPPFSSNPCSDPFGVIDSLEDPNFIYNLAPLKQCIALCKKAANDCREQVHIGASCELAVQGDQATYDAATCLLQNPSDSAARKECNAGKAQSRSLTKGEIRSERDSALASCQSWLATCVATCGAS